MSMGSKILWLEGMTLAPQHFQLQDIYHESRLRRMAAALDPHFWGVQSVQWNLDGLGHNRLTPVAMSVIFPDGEVYEAPGADLLPEPVDLSSLPSDVQTFTFHVALPIVRPHGGNADQDGRYARCEVATLDLFSEALETEVPFLKKRARLVSHLAPRDSHISVPVVRVHRSANGGFELDPSFIPPCVAIGAAPALQCMLDGLISALTTKIESLQRMHRKTNADVYEVSTGDISSWWMLNIVSTASALLRHSSQSPGHHPESLYQTLLSLAGGLMTFSDRYKAVDLPAYRHDALGDVFGKMDALLRDLVDTVIAAKYFLIPLVPDKSRPAFYRGILDPAKVKQETQLCLAVNADMPALELVALVPVRLKLGAPDDLENIVGAALPGVPLTHLPQVPSAIPVRPNTYYFSIATKGALYENALKAGALAVYVPHGIPGLKLELIAIS
jgi:type VI secretion system protein ImpJ